MFGMAKLGSAIFWPIFAAVLLTVPPLFIQWSLHGQATVASFFMIMLILVLAWTICVHPLWRIHSRLDKERDLIRQKANEHFGELESALGETEDPERVGLLQAKLESAEGIKKRADSLRTIPLSTPAWLSGIAVVLASLSAHILAIVKNLVGIFG